MLYELDERSLRKLVRDYEVGKLEKVLGVEDRSPDE